MVFYRSKKVFRDNEVAIFKGGNEKIFYRQMIIFKKFLGSFSLFSFRVRPFSMKSIVLAIHI